VGAGFEPTKMNKVRWMLDIARAGPGDVVYDLGSGDGRIVMEAARRGSRAVGIEADPIRVMWSRMMVRFSGLSDRARIVWGNFFDSNFRDATVVTLFLMPHTNRRLRSRLREELRPGTRVVSYVWKIEGWEPAMADPKKEMYLYVV
jgi:precorrin-6B methylase 2